MRRIREWRLAWRLACRMIFWSDRIDFRRDETGALWARFDVREFKLTPDEAAFVRSFVTYGPEAGR